MILGAIVAFLVVLPMALPREINTLRHFSVLGVFCALYLVLAILIVFWSDRDLVPDPIKNI